MRLPFTRPGNAFFWGVWGTRSEFSSYTAVELTHG